MANGNHGWFCISASGHIGTEIVTYSVCSAADEKPLRTVYSFCRLIEFTENMRAVAICERGGNENILQSLDFSFPVDAHEQTIPSKWYLSLTLKHRLWLLIKMCIGRISYRVRHGKAVVQHATYEHHSLVQHMLKWVSMRECVPCSHKSQYKHAQVCDTFWFCNSIYNRLLLPKPNVCLF